MNTRVPSPARTPRLGVRFSARSVRSGVAWTSFAIVALFVGSAFVVVGGLGGPVGGADPSTSPTAAHAPTPAASHSVEWAGSGAASGSLQLSPHPTGAPPASGRGTFFDTANLSQPSIKSLSCYVPYSLFGLSTCPNTTFDPSINVTASGEIGVAFTAFTDYSHCASTYNVTNHTMVDVAFQSSSNGGTTWSPIVYLGNQNCTDALNYTDAWQPSLTSLSNGTFVVSYTEFNLSGCYAGAFFCEIPSPPTAFPFQVPNSALVVQESFNGGSAWTAPDVLNSTFNATAEQDLCANPTGSPLYHPWISSNGTGLFLAYENISDASGCLTSTTSYSAGVHLISSANGGSSWSLPVNFPTIGDGGASMYGYTTNFSVNPFVLAAPNGQVYVAYATGLSAPGSYCQSSGCLSSGAYTQDVVVANASHGAGTWTVRTAATNQPFDIDGDPGTFGNSPFFGIAPQLAYNGVNGQLYLTYDSQAIGAFCSPNLGAAPTCATGLAEDAAVFQNSSNLGANWSGPTEVGSLVDPYNGSASAEYLPTLAVTPNGTVDVTVQLFNDSGCAVLSGTPSCGATQQTYLNSTDNGAHWGAPLGIAAYPWPVLNLPYTGEYETATTAPSGTTYFAWAGSSCPPPPAGPMCRFGDAFGTEPNTTVAVSSLFTGTGLTVTFHETNLSLAATWSADLLGNVRSAPAGTDLVVTGVPTGQPMSWSVSWDNISYGVTWEPVPAATNPVPPASFAASTTLDFDYQAYVLLTFTVNPPLPSSDLTAGSDGATFDMSPLPGPYWEPAGAVVPLVVGPQPISCAVSCAYENLTWVSWTGVGNGSVNTNATTTNLTVGSTPVNETANFLDLGNCNGGSGVVQCYGPYAYPLTFAETGLPSGTTWGATIVANTSATGTFSASTPTPWLNVSTGQNAVQFTLWTVPDGTTGMVWVPTSDPTSPVQEPTQTLVEVTYALEDATNVSFVANLSAAGLPNDTVWSADVGASEYAVTQGNLSLPLTGGTEYGLNGSVVYTEAGVAYFAVGVSVLPYEANQTWQNTTTLPDPVWFNGSARVVIQYSPEFWLTVTASVGGNVTPASEWVDPGVAVTVNETPAPGYSFLDWTGVGTGSSTTLQDHDPSITIYPGGPVNELASFAKIPPPTWNVTVTANGLPQDVVMTFSLGTAAYSGSGSGVTVSGVANGTYVFSASTVYANASNGTRWVPTSWNSSFLSPLAGMVDIHSDGSVEVNYTTEYVLTVSATSGGSVAPTPLVGSTWQDAGSSWELTASPSYHEQFAGWNASGPGAVTGSAPQITVTVNGPLWETAAFTYRVFPTPAVFDLTVTESGLPSGTPWGLSTGTGSSSASGSTAALDLGGLNGTYSLVVPAIYLGFGTRYVANGSVPIPANVTSNGSASVVFAEQFAFTVTASVGGSVEGAGTTWVAAGTAESLGATPVAGYQFVTWDGTGSGGAAPYSGPVGNSPVTVNGPTNETATFAPIVAQPTTGSATAGMAPALGLLAALLVVGLVVGLILGARRGAGPAASGESPTPGSEGEPPSASNDGSSAAAPDPHEDSP